VGFYVNRAKRSKDKLDVNVLVLTFNRTLRGYIKELAEKQLQDGDGINLSISTFTSWASGLLNNPPMIENDKFKSLISFLGRGIALPDEFIIDELNYILGKFPADSLDEYLTTRRDGRGATPRMEKPLRESLLNEVVIPYLEYKNTEGLVDYHDLANLVATQKIMDYDVVVVDETQDFSANEIRAIMNQLSEEHTTTFVLDTTQRIYTRSSFTWQEVGVTIRPEYSHRLSINYRNTKQIASFAAGILDGITPDTDGSMPNFESAIGDGEFPIIIEGKFSSQMNYIIQHIKNNIDLKTESVAFLHAKGGGWFRTVKEKLTYSGFKYALISRKSEWPDGDENIALSTLHSAKGLEFDHVFILGLDHQVIPVNGDDEESLSRLRKLIAMGVGRAKKGIVIGYNSEDVPIVAKFFKKETCNWIKL
uniref:3'-5' exonuclease n=1 Tax=Janthinobacterium sp. TaxID=1871054 RepID=UPI002626E50A